LTYLLRQRRTLESSDIITQERSAFAFNHLKGQDSRSVNLLDLRQRQHNLSPIPRPILRLTGVVLQVNRLELCQVGELGVERAEVGNLVSARLQRQPVDLLPLDRLEGREDTYPEFLQLCQMRNALNLFDHVVANVQGL
jgi:hypothetical protein